jgi:hypothetical protein
LQRRIDQGMAAYHHLGSPDTWAEAEKAEKVRGAVILNTQRQLEVEVAAGKLITPEQASERLESLALACSAAIDSIPEVMADLADAPDRPAARRTGKTVSKRINNRVAEIMRGG